MSHKPIHYRRSSHRRSTAAASIAVVLIAAASYWCLSVRWWSPQPGLTVQPEYLHIGEVWAREQFPWTLPVRNATQDVVQVKRFESGCGCTAVKPTNLSLASGQTVDLDVTLDLTKLFRPSNTGFEEDFLVEIIPVYVNVKPPHSGWRLHGRLRRPLAVSQTRLHFDEPLVAGKACPPRTLRVKLEDAGQDLRVSTDQSILNANMERSASSPREYLVAIQPLSGLGVGKFESVVRLGVTHRDKRRLVAPESLVRVTGEVVPDIGALPQEIHFGTQPIATVLHTDLQIKSRSMRSFTIAAVVAGSNIVLEPSEQSFPMAASSFNFSLYFSPDQPGPNTSRAEFFVHDDAGRQTLVSVAVHTYIANPTEIVRRPK